jgi:carbon-monoxide dehydrogenase large subunit
VEDLRFLRGRGTYVDDVTRPGLLHAVILRSSIAHGRIVAIDTAAARERPGVHAVITAASTLRTSRNGCFAGTRCSRST